MARYLDFAAASNGYVSVDCATSDGSPSWEIEFKFKPPSGNPVSSFYRIAGESSPAGADNRIIISTAGNDFRYYRNGVTYRVNTSVDLSAEPVIKFRSNGNGVELLINGAPKGTAGSGVVGVGLGNLGANFNTYFDGGLYYFKFTDNNTPSNSRYYDPSASVGQDVLVDTESDSNGTPVNFSDFEAALIYYDDGSGGTAQTITVISSEELHQAATLSVSFASQVSSIAAEQTQNASLLDVFTSQLATSIQAQQVESALPLNANQSLTVQAVPAQETHNANTLSIQQSAGQAVSSIAAEQVEQATALNLVQQQTLATIVAEQISDADITNVQSLQAVTMAVAQESHQASTVDIQQYNGQLVTLIVAQQENQAQTLFISEVSAVDLLQASQTESAEVVAFTQTQRLTQITAEQLTEAQIISIISAGDNTDLTGLRLTPVTQKYSITPVYTNQYSIQKV